MKIVPQVGKYRIDLGIKKDGRYLLGVECDGTLYHNHKAVRENDSPCKGRVATSPKSARQAQETAREAA